MAKTNQYPFAMAVNPTSKRFVSVVYFSIISIIFLSL